MLNKIVQAKYKEVEAAKIKLPLSNIRDNVEAGSHVFYNVFMQKDWSLIAECKLASPVKGIFHPGRTVADLAAIYNANGATALSVLTDCHFEGSLDDIGEAKKVSSLPILRKDFIVDIYQIYEARALKADAVLLIAAVLADDEIISCLKVADELGMDCLVEVHTLEELQRVLKTPANIIGINNRDLTTFTTSIHTTHELMQECETGKLIISESGVRTQEDALLLKSWGVKGILVGEGLVTAPNIALRTRELSLSTVQKKLC
ncbi:hypothetical protein P22_3108 [Propionispora sp. 2/2-37]|uniref:indole-3-glycerol phosphate synthase TrpC n=1 Tax=Propionispora sp. 2/2-37 TaxID=1677858 RepID=UPI0006BB8C27|nr:indole-3-glycerol phosphate synthase TrpC [Propionispora sp. 2/2-37]CUH96982.1 hypothetical protein P22_3108 [Propionispora sp. 2/2-37]